MGVHTEDEPDGGITPEGGPLPAVSQEQIQELRTSAASVTRELQILGEQVTALVAAVEALGPVAVAPATLKQAEADEVPGEAEDSKVMTVTVAPLPELAMAAVAETTLRNLPGVRQVTGVKREGDWARFTLDVSPDTDLISEMSAAMPVSFNVTESTPGAVSLDLQWAWGTS